MVEESEQFERSEAPRGMPRGMLPRMCYMLMTFSASCMAVIISSILVVSPTCLFSRRSKWVKEEICMNYFFSTNS